MSDRKELSIPERRARRKARKDKEAATVEEFAKEYTMCEGSDTKKLATFLIDLCEALPGAFCSKRLAAKVVFGRNKLPAEDSMYVEKINNMRHGARRIIRLVPPHDLYYDPASGMRVTHSHTDTTKTTLRASFRRLQAAARSYRETDALVDSSKVDESVREELTDSRRFLRPLKRIEEAPRRLPAGNTPNKDEG